MNNKRVNEQIKSKRVMVIGFDGSQLGEMPVTIAISKAYNQGYDLVEVSNKAKYPICKIMDWGKYQFDQRKQERKNKSNKRKERKNSNAVLLLFSMLFGRARPNGAPAKLWP